VIYVAMFGWYYDGRDDGLSVWLGRRWRAGMVLLMESECVVLCCIAMPT
jgi:hypothetical protein